MSRLKYISLAELKESINDIIDEVSREDVEYIVMVVNQPKVRIAPLTDESGKNVVVEDKIDDSTLKKFVE